MSHITKNRQSGITWRCYKPKNVWPRWGTPTNIFCKENNITKVVLTLSMKIHSKQKVFNLLQMWITAKKKKSFCTDTWYFYKTSCVLKCLCTQIRLFAVQQKPLYNNMFTSSLQSLQPLEQEKLWAYWPRSWTSLPTKLYKKY